VYSGTQKRPIAAYIREYSGASGALEPGDKRPYVSGEPGAQIEFPDVDQPVS
jgi:hypothetical protein